MSLEVDLQELAAEVRPVDGGTAERLDSLAQVVQTGANIKPWVGVDLFRSIDYSSAVSALRHQPVADRVLGWLEWARNLLALTPVLVTWIGLMYAAAGYGAAIAAEPALIERPFLLLWEERFHGYTPYPLAYLDFMTLQHLALIDVVLVFAIILLTVFIHRQLNITQVTRERQARSLERRMHHTVWRASLVIAERAAELASLDQFRIAADGLLDELRAERARVGNLAAQQERDTADLRAFVSGFKSGAKDLARYSLEIKESVDALTDFSAKVDDRLADLARQQSLLEASLAPIGAAMVQHNDFQRTAVDQLDVTAQLLVEGSDKSVSTLATVGRSVVELRDELAALRTYLGAERSAYQAAAQAAELSASSLSHAVDAFPAVASEMRGSADTLRTLVEPLGSIPPRLDSAARRQENAATAITSAAAKFESAMTGVEAQLGDTVARVGAATAQAAAGLNDVAKQATAEVSEVARTTVAGMSDVAKEASATVGGAATELRRIVPALESTIARANDLQDRLMALMEELAKRQVEAEPARRDGISDDGRYEEVQRPDKKRRWPLW